MKKRSERRKHCARWL